MELCGRMPARSFPLSAERKEDNSPRRRRVQSETEHRPAVAGWGSISFSLWFSAQIMKYAVIRLAGRQFKVEEGQKFEISKTDQLEPEVLLLVDGEKVEIGEPVLKKIKVEVKILEEKRGKKVEIRRYKAKTRYRRKIGHRQPMMYKAKTRYRRKIGHRQPMMILEVGGIGRKSTERKGTKGTKGTEGTEGVSKRVSKKVTKGKGIKGTKGAKGTKGTKGIKVAKKTNKG